MTANIRVTVRSRVVADPLPGMERLLDAIDAMSDEEAAEVWDRMARRYLARIGDAGPTEPMIARAVGVARTGGRPGMDEVTR